MRFLLLLSLSLLAFGCSKKEGKPCPEDGNCGDGLRCEPSTKTCQSICGKPSDCGKGLNCDESIGICFSKFDRAKTEECRRSIECRDFGNCSAVNGKCIAAKDEDCAKICKNSGLCKAVDGACLATKDEHCASSGSCKYAGTCEAVDGACKATKDEHCASTVVCEQWGLCKAVNGACLATKDEHEDDSSNK